MANHWIKVPGCEGEATDKGHQKEIDIQSWAWGVVHPVSPTGPGQSSGEATAHDLSVTKRIDKATPTLVQFCLSGKHLDEIVLTARKRGEDTIDYLKVTMKGAIVTAVSPSGSEGVPGSEAVSFNFAEVAIEYTPQSDDGKAGATSKAAWNLKENVKK
ncbi:MAG TPA: type VI secretion system tube protein Hcp [Methylomirabilota bacterium]|jgi:type VI secretion system secreted protein Hcp